MPALVQIVTDYLGCIDIEEGSANLGWPSFKIRLRIRHFLINPFESVFERDSKGYLFRDLFK